MGDFFSLLTPLSQKEYTKTLVHFVYYLARVTGNMDFVQPAGNVCAAVTTFIANPNPHTVHDLILAVLRAPDDTTLVWFLKIAAVKEDGDYVTPYDVRQLVVKLVFFSRVAVLRCMVVEVDADTKLNLVKLVKNL